jgi:hypothetical protein
MPTTLLLTPAFRPVVYAANGRKPFQTAYLSQRRKPLKTALGLNAGVNKKERHGVIKGPR